MGNRVSSSNEVVIDVKTAVEITTTIIQNNSITIAQAGARTNTFTLETAEGSNIVVKNIKNIQSIDANTQASGRINDDIINTLNVDLKSALDAAVDQASTGKTGIFAFGETVSTVNKNIAKNALSLAVDTYIKKDNWNAVVQSVVDINQGKIFLRGNVTVQEDIINDQKLVSRLIAKAVIDSVIDNANSIIISNNNNVRISQKADSTAGLFAGGSGMLASIVSSVVLCIIAIIILVIFLKMRSNK